MIAYFVLISIITLTIIYVPTPLSKGNNPLAKLRSRVTVSSLTSGSSTLRRIATWKFTWMMIEDYPILGSGLGTYDYHTFKYQAEFFAIGNNRDIYPHGFAEQAHNEYLQLWSELGIMGLLLFISIFYFFYKNILRAIKKMEEKEKAITIGLTGGITAILIDAIFGFPLQLVASGSLFWIFLGLSSAQIIIVEYGLAEDGKESYCRQNKQKQNTIIKTSKKENSFLILKKILLSTLVIAFIVVSIFF